MTFSSFGLVLCCLIIAGCGQQQSEQIEWQLPLSAPVDPHGARVQQALPAWLAEQAGHASFVLLQKSTTRLVSMDLDIGNDGPDMADWKLWLKNINIQVPAEDISTPKETNTRP